MKKEILNKLYEKIDYNTLNILKKINDNVFWISLFTNVIFEANNSPFLNIAFITNMSSLLLLTGNNLLNAESHTKDISNINKLYKEIIKDFNVINKDFGLTNPVEIYASFLYLLDKGYFFKDKHFEKTSKNVRDITSIMGANIIAGQGVC